MARRKRAQEPTATEAPAEQTPVTEAAPVEPPRVQIQPEGIVHAPAEPPEPRQQEPERLPEHGHEGHHAARHHPREHGPSHADSVGKREFKPSPDPFGIAGDYVAGVRLLESKKYREMVLKFEEKPSQDVIDKLKSAGYRYNGPSKAWTHGLDQENAMSVRIEAEKLFNELSGMIRSERGVNHGYGGRS